MHCSQRRLHGAESKGRGDSQLYWTDEGPPVGAGGSQHSQYTVPSAQLSQRKDNVCVTSANLDVDVASFQRKQHQQMTQSALQAVAFSDGSRPASVQSQSPVVRVAGPQRFLTRSHECEPAPCAVAGPQWFPTGSPGCEPAQCAVAGPQRFLTRSPGCVPAPLSVPSLEVPARRSYAQLGEDLRGARLEDDSLQCVALTKAALTAARSPRDAQRGAEDHDTGPVFSSYSSEVGGLSSSNIDGSGRACGAHSEQLSFSPVDSQGAPVVSTVSSMALAPTADHSCLATVSEPAPVPKVSTAKNLHMLVELHCAHDHWNFEDVAKHYGLSLPVPRPDCWACLMAKPRAITPDKSSTRVTQRPFQGLAADAKGPMKVESREGFRYFFVIVCLYSSYYWVKLAQRQSQWKDIWPAFVKSLQAKTGNPQTVSFIVTDGHRVHSAGAIQSFNSDRGIETITTAPYSQWQDPAERGIQTIMNGARCSLIHGGGREWMWSYAVRHACDSANRMPHPRPAAGMEGKSRLRIMDPDMTASKEMRTHRPFLCLCFAKQPGALMRSDFAPRAEPCVYLLYDRMLKSYTVLTIPNLYVRHTIEVRFVAGAYPLRVTNHLSNQLNTFLRPTVEDELYANVHGPANILRRPPKQRSDVADALVQSAPVLVSRPVAQTALQEPARFTSRGFRPSIEALESIASAGPSPPLEAFVAASVVSAPSLAPTFTADQLAARTPRNGHQALRGPDSGYWIPGIKKDFAIIRENKCIINVTNVRPPGPAPPCVEQRFKIKYRGDKPIALAAIEAACWKARTVARGDRFKYGVHFDATAAPVIHTPSLKVLVAWAVRKGLLVFQWDVGAAFYGNKMDRTGIIVQLPPGYDPDSTDLRPLHMPPLYGELAGALPGIPQGSLLHYEAMTPELAQLGFRSIAADNCLFLHDTIEMATSLHVDDGVLACPSLRHAEQVLGSAGLGRKRKITWGPLQSTLGIDFDVSYTAERRLIFMSQRAFAVTILERAGMSDCNATRLPANAGRVYTKDDCPTTDEQKAHLAARGLSKESYHSVQASLNFLVNISRDDMRFANGKTAKYCLNPGEEHFRAQKQELRFLKGTLDYGIQFVWRKSDPAPVDGPIDIVAWSDSSYADDKDTGRTTLGSVVQVNGAVVTSTSKLSARVDSCVNHSELNAFAQVVGSPPSERQLTDGASTALMKTARTVAWIRGVKAGLERRSESSIPPTPVMVDNTGVIAMLKDATLKSANKHIYKTLQENRERVHLDKAVVAVKVDTKNNIANALTKQEHCVADSVAQFLQLAGPRSPLYDK